MPDTNSTPYKESGNHSSSLLDSVEVFALPSSQAPTSDESNPVTTTSFTERLANLLNYVWRVVQDRQSPAIYFLLGIFLLLILTSPLRWTILMSLLCLVSGYALASPSLPSHPHYLKSFLPLFLAPVPHLPKVTQPEKKVTLSTMSLSSSLQAKLTLLVDYFIRDFIDYWYEALNQSGHREFQSNVRSALLSVIDSFLVLTTAHKTPESVDLVSLIIYGLTNAIILHMKEFREFERASPQYASLESFIEGHSDSPYWKGFHTSHQAELEHLQHVAALLLSRLLPPEDAASAPLFSLLKELISGQFLWPLLDKLSEPDTLNALLLRWLKANESIAEESLPLMNMSLKITQIQNIPFLSSAEFYLVFGIDGTKKKTRLLNLYSPKNKTEPIFFQKLRLKPAVTVSIWLMAYHHLSKDRCIAQSRFSLGTVELLASMKEYSIAMRLRDSEEPVLVVVQLTAKEMGRATEATPTTTAMSVSSEPLSETSASQKLSIAPLVPLAEGLLPSNIETAELTLDNVLESNDLFADFYEYMNESGTPPFLQFWMNADSFRRFVTMELSGSMDLAVEASTSTKSNATHTLDRDQMFIIRRDALDVYACHFGPNAKLYIPMHESILEELRAELEPQIDPFKWPSRPDYKIGPNVFMKAQKYVYDLLGVDYFPLYLKFLKSGGRSRSRRSQAGLGWHRARAWIPHFNPSQSSSQSRRQSQTRFLEESKKHKSGFPFYYQLDMTEKESTELAKAQSTDALTDTSVGLSRPDMAPKMEEEINYESLTVQLENREDEERGEEAGADGGFSIFDYQFQPLTLPSRSKSEGESILFSVSYMTRPSSDYQCLLRSFGDFKALHASLVDLFPSLSFPELKEEDWEAAIPTRLEIFLTRVLSDEKMSCRAAVKEFFKTDLQPNQVHANLQASLNATADNETDLKSVFLRAFKRVPNLLRAISKNPISDTLGHPLPEANAPSRRRSTMGEKEQILEQDQHQEQEQDQIQDRKQTDNTTQSSASSSTSRIESQSLQRSNEFNEAEMNLLLETFFGLIEEAFDLHDKNRWLRRKIFSVFKQLIVQAYGQNIYRLLKGRLQELKSEERTGKLLDVLLASLWPNGEWADVDPPSDYGQDEEMGPNDLESSSNSSLRRSDAARAAWLAQSPELLEHLLGRYHTVHGMKRIFEMTQYKTLNKRLLFIFLDVLVKLLFTTMDQETKR